MVVMFEIVNASALGDNADKLLRGPPIRWLLRRARDRSGALE
jgi:hypothetical protein